jgi:hypothetical protein
MSSSGHFTNRLIIAVLIIGLFVSSIPPSIGVDLVKVDSHPAFSLNICHPLQSVGLTASCAIIAPEPRFSLHPRLADLGPQVQMVVARLNDLSDQRDPPPPR